MENLQGRIQFLARAVFTQEIPPNVFAVAVDTDPAL
jgi:hypothetical protein